MKPQDYRNYQPVMIKMLNQNDGEATRKQIRKELHNANPDLPEEKRFRTVFTVLEKNGVVEDDLYFPIRIVKMRKDVSFWRSMPSSVCDEKSELEFFLSILTILDRPRNN